MAVGNKVKVVVEVVDFDGGRQTADVVGPRGGRYPRFRKTRKPLVVSVYPDNHIGVRDLDGKRERVIDLARLYRATV